MEHQQLDENPSTLAWQKRVLPLMVGIILAFSTFFIVGTAYQLIHIQSKIEYGTIVDVKHDGTGCSICCSSASVMSETLKGKTKEEAMIITENYLNMLSNKDFDDTVDLEEAIVYTGVRKFPARIKCASIAWKAFEGTAQESE